MTDGSYMVIQKLSYPSFSVLGATCLMVLAVCASPNSIPTGYVYHDKEFKSPNPPASPKFTTLQRSAMGPKQAEQFRLAMYSLVDNLTNRAGMPPKPVYVMTPETMTPFYANMDNDLRESLRHIGYRLADSPDGAYVITYNAVILKPVSEKKDGNKPMSVVPVADDNTTPNVKMAIHVHDSVGKDGKMLTQEEGSFFVQGAQNMSVPTASFYGVPVPSLSKE